MRYATAIDDAFARAILDLPEEIRGDVWADKYKYLTDASLIRNAAPSAGAHILDIGGARSPNTLMLRELGFNAPCMIDRFDRTEAEVLSRRDHPTRHFWERAGIDARQWDVAVNPLPYADASFDMVSAVDIIEHFTVSGRQFFSEVYRVLKPGGVLVTGSPNVANLQNRFKILFGKSNHSRLSSWHNTGHYIGHIREFTPQEIEWMLKEAGFQISWRYMGEEELDSVIRDRAKLQRDRSAGSNRLDLSKPGDLAFYLFVLVYYGFVKIFPGCRYFSRVIARKPG